MTPRQPDHAAGDAREDMLEDGGAASRAGWLLPLASDLHRAAQAAIAARRSRPFDELAQRRQQIEQERGAFMARRPEPGECARVAALVRQKAEAGEMIAHVLRFPSEYCTDRGRAVNNDQHDWPETLQGLAHAHYELLAAEFVPRGFQIGAVIISWPMLMPGDVSLFLSWRD